MVHRTISKYQKAKIWKLLLFSFKNKFLDSIPYHDNVESFTLYIPDIEDDVDNNSIPF